MQLQRDDKTRLSDLPLPRNIVTFGQMLIEPTSLFDVRQKFAESASL